MKDFEKKKQIDSLAREKQEGKGAMGTKVNNKQVINQKISP